MREILIAALVIVVIMAARGSSEDFTPSWVAAADGEEVPIYPLAGAGDANMHLANPRENGEPLVFLVDESVEDIDVEKDEWLPVVLPIRPNGSRGWVKAKDVKLTRNDYRIEIDVEARRLELIHQDEVELETEIGVGTRSTPTPAGTYFVNEVIQPPEPDGLYGAFVLGLSGFSDAPGARDFNGGNGALGIHGTNNTAGIGQEVSHGCIRVSNEAITHMASVVPIGTPVEISYD